MAEIVWTEPARIDLEAIHDYVAIESPAAAIALVARILRHVDQLARHPDSGSWLPELGRSRYRQWMTHKLGTWHDQFGSSGCVGCGRCITWCPVGIDITEEVAAIRSTDGETDARA